MTSTITFLSFFFEIQFLNPNNHEKTLNLKIIIIISKLKNIFVPYLNEIRNFMVLWQKFTDGK